MANRITDEQKIEINKLYKEIGTYSGVAKKMGISPSSVKKYVVLDLQYDEPNIVEEIGHIDPLPVEEITQFTTPDQIYKATEITKEEIEEMKTLWRQILI